MASIPDMPAEQDDELYGLPLEQFTAARDHLARRLRADGDRPAAARVKQLRKPSIAAWALNQVRRHNRERVEELIGAGERLREAQQRLLAGGEHGPLRDAAAGERRLVQEVAQLAERELAQAGHASNATLQNKLWQTLHAAARDEETRELLRAGRLVRENEISDFGLPGVEAAPGSDAPPPRPRDPAPAPKKPRAATPAPARRNAALERKRAAARRRLEQATERQHQLEQKLRDAESEAVSARSDAKRAIAAAERAEASAEQARARAREAARRSGELEAVVAELESAAG